MSWRRRDGLTDTHCCLAKARDVAAKKPGALKGPSLVGIVEMRLAVVCHILSLGADDDGGIIVLGTSGPFVGNISRLGVADSNGALVFQGCTTSPERTDASTRGLKKRVYFSEGPETVS